MSIPIVFGWGKGTKELGAGFFHACTNCRNVRRFVVAEASRNASLYFITVAKWSYKYFYVCPVCLRGFEIPTRELAQRILAGALRDPRNMPDELAAEIAQANGLAIAVPEDQYRERGALRREDQAAMVEEARSCKLGETLNEFLSLEPRYQESLAGSALDWTLTSLARSPRRREAESAFWAAVEFLYVGTNDASRKFSDKDRGVMSLEAAKRFQQWVPAVVEIIGDCVRANAVREQGAVRRAFEEILYLRTQLIQHARAADLRELVGACVALCSSLCGNVLSDAEVSDLDNRMAAVQSVMGQIATWVQELLAAGGAGLERWQDSKGGEPCLANCGDERADLHAPRNTGDK